MDQIGKYEVLDKIGSGGFAVVYKGYDPFIKRPVAIKVCYSRDDETRQRFFREAEIAGRLVHRNVTTVYDFGVHEKMPFLVEEYLSGEDLAHMIRRREPHLLDEKLDYLLQIASGLEYAHRQGVIHRDIKPGNVRVLDNGRVKIMDFGTAKLANVESNLTQTGMTLGTVAYLSPERLLGQACGLNSDVFSFGVLAYELLSFERPFAARNIPLLIDQVINSSPSRLSDSWPQCPPKLAELVHRCLFKDPARRYSTCTEVINDLEEVRDETLTIRQQNTTANAETRASRRLNLQVSGFLERARQLQAQGKFTRAEMLLDEVLELDPDNAEARSLLDTCRERSAKLTKSSPVASKTPVSTGALESSTAKQERKTAEAIASIQAYIARGAVLKAVEALRFANRLLGDFDQVKALRIEVVDSFRSQISFLASHAGKQSARLGTDLAGISSQLEHNELARVVGLLTELDPGQSRLTDLLRRPEAKTVRPLAQDSSESELARKQKDAIATIEKLIAEGDPEMAHQALVFAVRMLGTWDQVPRLEQQVARARDQSP